MTLNLVNKIASNADKMIIAGGIIATAATGAAKAYPGTAFIGESVALFGLMVAATALIIGMANSLKNADCNQRAVLLRGRTPVAKVMTCRRTD